MLFSFLDFAVARTLVECLEVFGLCSLGLPCDDSALTDGMSQTELQPQVSSATPPSSLSLWSGLTISERYFPKTGRKDWHLVSLLQLSVKQYPYHSGSLSEKGKEVVLLILGSG